MAPPPCGQGRRQGTATDSSPGPQDQGAHEEASENAGKGPIWSLCAPGLSKSVDGPPCDL